MANILTISRMVFSLILLLPPAFSTFFAVIYFLAGLTDMPDGWVARKTGTASESLHILQNMIRTGALVSMQPGR